MEEGEEEHEEEGDFFCIRSGRVQVNVQMVCYGVRKYMPDLFPDRLLTMAPDVMVSATMRYNARQFASDWLPQEFQVQALHILQRSFFDLANVASLPDAIAVLVGTALRIRSNTPDGWLYSAVEAFAGVGNIDKKMKEAQLRSIALDIEYDEAHLDILTSVGFAIYMYSLLATKADAYDSYAHASRPP